MAHGHHDYMLTPFVIPQESCEVLSPVLGTSQDSFWMTMIAEHGFQDYRVDVAINLIRVIRARIRFELLNFEYEKMHESVLGTL